MSKVLAIMETHSNGIDRPAVHVAFIAADAGETAVTIDRAAFYRLWDAGLKAGADIEPGYMALGLDSDRPVEWADAFSEER